MGSVFDYLDYRQFLREACQREKERKTFASVRYLAGRIGMDPGQFSKILQGQLHLATVKIPAAINLLALEGREAEYFETLVHFCKAKSRAQVQIYYEKLLTFKEVRSTLIGKGQERLYQNWYTVAIYTLLDGIATSSQAEDLANLLRPKITTEQAQQALETLRETGLVVSDDSGKLKACVRHLDTPGRWHHLMVHRYQKEIFNLAAAALDAHPKQHREMTTLAMSLDADTLSKVRAITEEYRDCLMKVVDECKQPTMAFQFCLGLFPLTRWEGKKS